MPLLVLDRVLYLIYLIYVYIDGYRYRYVCIKETDRSLRLRLITIVLPLSLYCFPSRDSRWKASGEKIVSHYMCSRATTIVKQYFFWNNVTHNYSCHYNHNHTLAHSSLIVPLIFRGFIWKLLARILLLLFGNLYALNK